MADQAAAGFIAEEETRALKRGWRRALWCAGVGAWMLGFKYTDGLPLYMCARDSPSSPRLACGLRWLRCLRGGGGCQLTGPPRHRHHLKATYAFAPTGISVAFFFFAR